MAFELSEEQRELAGTVDRLLADSTAGPRARQLIEDPDGWRELWAAVADLGVLAMAAPEASGGLGLGPVELVAVAEAVGRHLAPGPIVATAGAFVPTLAPLAADRPLAAAALTAVAEDGATAALAVGDGSIRDGRLTAALVVPDAEKLDWIGLPVAEGIVLLERSQFTLEAAAEIDPSRPLARVRVEDVDVTERLLPAPPGGLAVAHATAAAELVGLADALLRVSVAYAGERQQFGVAIGSFQALKHRLADVLIAVERARSHVWHAAVLAQAGTSADTAAHFAKAAAGDAVTAAARAAVQVHGGIGITAEHDVSLLYLRARQAAFALGGGDEHALAAVARELRPPAGARSADDATREPAHAG